MSVFKMIHLFPSLVATITEETTRESEDEFESNLPMHLVTYTKVTVEIVTKYSEPRIKEIFPTSDQEEAKKKKGTLGEEQCPERATDSKHNHKAPATENSLQTNHNDTKDIPEGIEVREDKEQHQPSTSNIRKAFQTVASALWQKATKKHENKTSKKKLKKKKGLDCFLSKIKSKTRDP